MDEATTETLPTTSDKPSRLSATSIEQSVRDSGQFTLAPLTKVRLAIYEKDPDSPGGKPRDLGIIYTLTKPITGAIYETGEFDGEPGVSFALSNARRVETRRFSQELLAQANQKAIQDPQDPYLPSKVKADQEERDRIDAELAREFLASNNFPGREKIDPDTVARIVLLVDTDRQVNPQG